MYRSAHGSRCIRSGKRFGHGLNHGNFRRYILQGACIKWDFQQLDYKGKTGLLPFSIADADYPTYRPILDALKARIDNGVIGYTDLNEEYYAPVKNWIRRRHGWEIESPWIVPVGGIVPAMCNAIEALTARGGILSSCSRRSMIRSIPSSVRPAEKWSAMT